MSRAAEPATQANSAEGLSVGPWRAAALATAAGALAALALPPLHLLPLLWPAFGLLLWLARRAGGAGRALALGWCFGLGWYALGVYWVGHAFLVDAARHGWVMPFAVLGLAGGMALFIAPVAWAAWLCRARPWTAALALAAAWALSEWLRGWVLTGFPWNPLGSVWAFAAWPLQAAAVVGVLGLGLATLLAALLPFALPRWRGIGLAAAILLVVLLPGWWRLAAAPAPGARDLPGITLRLVQGNIPQAEKWLSDRRAGHLLDYLELSTGPGFAEVSHVIWPETAVPFFLSLESQARRLAARAAPAGGALVTGALRSPRAETAAPVFNSLHVIDPGGEILATYDKAHLVPFGEYFPGRDWPLIEALGLTGLAAGSRDISAGQDRRPIEIPGLPPAAVLICYEAIFSGAVVHGARPGLLLNVTNDAWFGTSGGPHQHFAAARLRAVEEGLPLIRAANTGISAVIDPYGRLRSVIALSTRGVADSGLPAALAPTLFSYWGQLPALLLTSALALAAALGVLRRRPSQPAAG